LVEAIRKGGQPDRGDPSCAQSRTPARHILQDCKQHLGILVLTEGVVRIDTYKDVLFVRETLLEGKNGLREQRDYIPLSGQQRPDLTKISRYPLMPGLQKLFRVMFIVAMTAERMPFERVYCNKLHAGNSYNISIGTGMQSGKMSIPRHVY
jgi:hypothetical protein